MAGDDEAAGHLPGKRVGEADDASPPGPGCCLGERLGQEPRLAVGGNVVDEDEELRGQSG